MLCRVPVPRRAYQCRANSCQSSSSRNFWTSRPGPPATRPQTSGSESRPWRMYGESRDAPRSRLRQHLVAAPGVAGDVERGERSVGGRLATGEGPGSPDHVAREVAEVPRDVGLRRRTATIGQRQGRHLGRAGRIRFAPAPAPASWPCTQSDVPVGSAAGRPGPGGGVCDPVPVITTEIRSSAAPSTIHELLVDVDAWTVWSPHVASVDADAARLGGLGRRHPGVLRTRGDVDDRRRRPTRRRLHLVLDARPVAPRLRQSRRRRRRRWEHAALHRSVDRAGGHHPRAARPAAVGTRPTAPHDPTRPAGRAPRAPRRVRLQPGRRPSGDAPGSAPGQPGR